MRSIGIDIIEIERFNNWIYYNKKQLLKIFTLDELNYCFDTEKKYSERLAGIFCAKEACYKALNSLFKNKISLIQFFKHIEIIRDLNRAPKIIINNYNIILDIKIKDIFLSISHNKSTAIAIVMVQ